MRVASFPLAIAGPLAAAVLCLPVAAFAQQPQQPQQPADEPQRQLGAHAHGTGKLSIAIEKRTVEIEIEAPGSDIVEIGRAHV